MLQPQILDVNAVLASMGEMLQRLLGERVVLEIDGAANPGTVEADPGDIEQILLNLVVNARDAMADGGVVTIRTANRTVANGGGDGELEPGSYVVLEVGDSGSGMDATTASQAFEPFFTTKDVGKGTGLGLSTVFGIAQRSGGRVDLETTPGRGTNLTVHLPQASAESLAQGASRETTTAVDPAGQTILLVEDADGVRGVVRETLRGAGYAVLEARDAGEALEICNIEPGPLDLMLTDVVMPGIAGPDLADRVRGRRPEMQVLYMSGYADDVLGEEVRRQAGLLHKPFSTRELLDAVAGVLHPLDRPTDNVVPLSSASSQRRLRLLIADDHPAVLSAMRNAFARENVEIVGEARDGADAIERIGATLPDIAVIDVRMPGAGGIEVTRRAAETSPGTAVVVYSGYAERDLLTQALNAGARGFVLKDAPLADLVRAVKVVASGETYADPRLAGLELSSNEPSPPQLTAREQDVLRLAAEGRTNNDISARLGISPETVQTHVRKAMAKLEAESRTQAVAKALRRSLIA